MPGRALAVNHGNQLIAAVRALGEALGLEVHEQLEVGRRLWGARRRIDVVLIDKQTRKTLGIECKYQRDKGTAEEKIPSTIQDISAWPIQGIVVFAGSGFTQNMESFLLSTGRAVGLNDLEAWLRLYFGLPPAERLARLRGEEFLLPDGRLATTGPRWVLGTLKFADAATTDRGRRSCEGGMRRTRARRPPVTAEQRRAFAFLTDRATTQDAFAIEELAAATGWSESTAKTYVAKQFADYLDKLPDGLHVRREFNRVTEAEFLRLVSQRRQVYAVYRRSRYEAVVTYEFLLPLTREGQLRAALDDLFYADTLRRRLAEIGSDTVRQIVGQGAREGDETFTARVCELVGDYFGGYSISHVSGQFRAGSLKDRGQAGAMLAADQRYLIDETTAVVRFIVPCTSSRSEFLDASERPKPDPALELLAGDMHTEIARERDVIRSLFFHLFVEAVVESIQGEDEIWLLERAPETRLYVCEAEAR